MSEQQNNFLKACKEIQKKCACPAFDAQECIRLRYPLPIDDVMRQFDEERLQDPEEWCECACHSEISEEEASQEWPL